MGLQLSVYDEYGGRQIARWGSRSRALRFGTGEHGYTDLTDFIELPMADVWRFYSLARTPWIVVHDQWMNLAWEGRLERPKIAPGGLQIAGFGYWQAYNDIPYTAFWGQTTSANWRPVTNDDVSTRSPERYNIDTNNRLYITLVPGNFYLNADNIGELTFAAPHQHSQGIAYFGYDYSYKLPTNWKLRIIRSSDDFSSQTTEQTYTGDGAAHSGSDTLSFTESDRILVQLVNNTGGNSAPTDPAGTWFGKLTDLVIAAQAPPVNPDDIAGALVTYMSGINANQHNTSLALIDASSLALTDEIYEDTYPTEILNYLAEKGDGSTPWEVGVWSDQRLHLRERSGAARYWQVDAGDIELERTLDTMVNSAYGVYSETGNRTLRTAVATDADSVSRWGITRRAAVSVSTTSATAAEAGRDKMIGESKEPSVRTALTIRRLKDSRGKDWPMYMAKSGDIVEITNLSPALGSAADKIRRFTLVATDYDAQYNTLQPVADLTLPTLETLVAESIIRRDSRLGS